jgi:hypothetical protein
MFKIPTGETELHIGHTETVMLRREEICTLINREELSYLFTTHFSKQAYIRVDQFVVLDVLKT